MTHHSALSAPKIRLSQQPGSRNRSDAFTTLGSSELASRWDRGLRFD
jgi:hypothetical protein